MSDETKLEELGIEKKTIEPIAIDGKIVTLTDALERAAERAETALQEFEKVTAQREIEELKTTENDEPKSKSGLFLVIGGLAVFGVAGYIFYKKQAKTPVQG
jgi:predicted HTH domain antitoxin